MFVHNDVNQMIVVEISLLVLSILCGLCLIYGLYDFWKLRHEMVIINRRGDLVIAVQICCIVILLLGYPLTFVYEYQHSRSIAPCYAVTIAMHICFNPFYYHFIFLSFARYWLIYYDFCFSKSMLNLEWKKIINTEFTYTEDEWYIAHRRNYGNQKYVTQRTVILSAFISAISLTAAFLHEFGVTTFRFYHLLNVIVLPFAALWLFYIGRKLPTFYDNIYMTKEAKILAYLCGFLLCVYMFSILLQNTMGWNVYALLLYYAPCILGAFFMPFFSTFWVVKQIKCTALLHNKSSSNSAAAAAAAYNNQYDRGAAVHTLPLKLIFASQELFDSFMQHVIKEFNVEVVLSLIEFMQFKQHSIETLKIDVRDIDADHRVRCSFPANTPLSAIVYGEEPMPATLSTVSSVASFHSLQTSEELRAQPTPETPGHGDEDVNVDVDDDDENPKCSETADNVAVTAATATVTAAEAVVVASSSSSSSTEMRLLKHKAYRLYEKYVKCGSQFEINISYKTKCSLDYWMANYDSWMMRQIYAAQLALMFEDCCCEMICLLNGSKQRFKHEPCLSTQPSIPKPTLHLAVV